MSRERPLPLADTDLVSKERVKVLTYALLHALASLYRDPKAALQAIDQHVTANGPDGVFTLLHHNPAAFGTLGPHDPDWHLPATTEQDVRSFACFALRFRLEAMAEPDADKPSSL